MADKAVSRREFLKIAGIAGATIGVGAGLGGLVEACGGTAATTTTTAAAATTTTAAAATTTTAAGATTTTASASVETGREVKVGWVTMTTGSFASLSEPDDYLLKYYGDAIGDGVVAGDGKKHPVKWIVKDSQSDANRAGEVAGQLITSDKVDIIMAGMTPVVCNPVSDQCEANGMPEVSYGAPWQAWYFRDATRAKDPTLGYKSVYHIFWGIEDLEAVYFALWNGVQTNKIVACLWANDPDGVATSDKATGFPPEMEKAGYKVVNPGLFTNGTEDFSSTINQFKSAGCEVLTVLATPPDFANFWKQAYQQGFHPKVATVARAILVRPDMEAIGDIGAGLSNEVWWTSSHPFKSAVTGQTCLEVATAWETQMNKGYNASLGLTGGAFETTIDVLKRVKNFDDPATIIDAIKTTNLETILGPIAFSGKPVPNIAKTPLVGGQWENNDPKWHWTRYTVDNSNYPATPITGKLHPIVYSS
jgi:branched-chain amino acid transport system substrate-binding protein